ncbi:MAG: hypothetical protein KDA92_10850, partial [Planctomycetales bacterium]|nr:hypothetical protein [Planctomycetales bacterium]
MAQFVLRQCVCRGLVVFCFASFVGLSIASAQAVFEQPPIDYLKAEPHDAITRLQQRLDRGEVKLEFQRQHGYLKSVLAELHVPDSSQILVFSKTSFQLRRISPTTPRAIYFNDEVYVGWVQGGDVMEVSTVDPQLGANFYTLSQRHSTTPKFKRHTHECLQCHASPMTMSVPGHAVRSVYTAPDGQPLLEHPSYVTDSASPFRQRWGGWYVSGTHGAQRHLGNLVVRQADDPSQLDLERGANVLDLEKFFDTSPYLTPHSDIVALMLIEHHSKLHNVLTQANFSARLALRDQLVLNEMLKRAPDFETESTALRLRKAADAVVQQLLCTGEQPLTDPVKGTSTFADDYMALRKPDTRGRSLRDLDLHRRIFKYPCSPLIYSEAFNGLPDGLRRLVFQ